MTIEALLLANNHLLLTGSDGVQYKLTEVSPNL
jgi:hypothetical protein